MATIVHDNFRNAQMGNPGGTTTTVDFNGDDVRASLLDQTDSGTITVTSQNYGQVNTTPVAEMAAALQNPTVGSVAVGVFDADSVTYTSVTGDTADYLVLYKHNATAANATLIATWDSATTGLPVTPNGGDITVTWNASGIVQI